MTATDSAAMSALHELLDERQRYQAWLSTLEGRRNSTPPHVYEHVRQDYLDRLGRVTQSLAERAETMSGAIETLTAELTTLRNHEAARTDERHEAELRAAVGEFTPEDWERRRAAADSDLERIAAERHSLESELAELQRIVGLTRSMESDAAASEGSSVDGSSAASATAIQREASFEAAPSIDNFVADRRLPQPQRGQPAANSDDRNIPDAPLGGNRAGAASADRGTASGVASGVASGPPGAPLLAPTSTPPLTPAAVGDSRREADKTLKCPECAAMNYATEWYCERCGGELSTF